MSFPKHMRAPRLAWSALLAASACAQPALTVTEATSPIRLDGRTDEPFWLLAKAEELTQQSPKPGQPAPYKTMVRVAASRENIYVAFTCTDLSPRQISIHTMQRDGDVSGDDFVSIALDTYGDRRTGYFFRVNAAGARIDGLVSGTEELSLDWNGIWDARVIGTAGGWSAEIVIPSRTLNFTPGLANWGANFERNIARDRTIMRWSSPTLDSVFIDLSRAGTLQGLSELRQGLGLEFNPFFTTRIRNEFQQGDRTFQAAPGGDFTYRITPQLALALTVNTDFAETEVDTLQLNLTRFAPLFPERRAFFLEGSNQFQFGLGLEEEFLPFFSRKMGLFEGQPIPINGGVRLSGRVGRWNVNLLDLQTRDTVLRSGQAVPGTNLFASRISYDVSTKLRLGSTVTNGNPDGVSRNTLAGFDGLWRTSQLFGNKNLLAGGWTAITLADASTGSRSGYGFKIHYPNDLWDCSGSLNKYGEALNPGLGFLPRPGVRVLEAGCEFKPRPRKDGPFRWIRQQFMDHRYSRVTNHYGRVESQSFWWAPLNIQLESGDRVEFDWIPSYEFLPVPFEIADGVVLPVGEYRFQRFRGEFESSSHRPFMFASRTWFGSFYNGQLLQQQNDLRYTGRRGRWQAGLSAEQYFGELEQGKFVQRLWQLDTTYAVSPNLALTNYLQYDSESGNIGNNMRLHWTIKPGNDFFIVWNRGWKRLILSRDDIGLHPDRELLAIKLRWTFRR
jgi:hypothetical protein